MAEFRQQQEPGTTSSHYGESREPCLVPAKVHGTFQIELLLPFLLSALTSEDSQQSRNNTPNITSTGNSHHPHLSPCQLLQFVLIFSLCPPRFHSALGCHLLGTRLLGVRPFSLFVSMCAKKISGSKSFSTILSFHRWAAFGVS